MKARLRRKAPQRAKKISHPSPPELPGALMDHQCCLGSEATWAGPVSVLTILSARQRKTFKHPRSKHSPKEPGGAPVQGPASRADQSSHAERRWRDLATIALPLGQAFASGHASGVIAAHCARPSYELVATPITLSRACKPMAACHLRRLCEEPRQVLRGDVG